MCTHSRFSTVNCIRLSIESGRDVSWLRLNTKATRTQRTQRMTWRRGTEEDDDTHDRSSSVNCVRLANQSGRDVRRRELQVKVKVYVIGKSAGAKRKHNTM